MYKITLADGTTLDDLELNGNNYIAQTLIDDAVFAGNLGVVTISDGETTQTYHDMILIQNTTYGDGRSWFILAEKTPLPPELAEYAAMLDAMMEGYLNG